MIIRQIHRTVLCHRTKMTFTWFNLRISNIPLNESLWPILLFLTAVRKQLTEILNIVVFEILGPGDKAFTCNLIKRKALSVENAIFELSTAAMTVELCPHWFCLEMLHPWMPLLRCSSGQKLVDHFLQRKTSAINQRLHYPTNFCSTAALLNMIIKARTTITRSIGTKYSDSSNEVVCSLEKLVS